MRLPFNCSFWLPLSPLVQVLEVLGLDVIGCSKGIPNGPSLAQIPQAIRFIYLRLFRQRPFLTTRVWEREIEYVVVLLTFACRPPDFGFLEFLNIVSNRELCFLMRPLVTLSPSLLIGHSKG